MQEKLESETEETEKERLVSLIQEINAKIEVIKTAQEEFIASTKEEEEPRRSTRDKKLTPKMQDLKEQEASNRESKFSKLYEKWKGQARDIRAKLKEETSDSDLAIMMDVVEGQQMQVREAYEDLRSHASPTTDYTDYSYIRRKMDSCDAMTKNLIGLLQVRMCEQGLDEFDPVAEKVRLDQVLNVEHAQSIFGTSVVRPLARRPSRPDSIAEQPHVSVKIAECAAELAAKKAEIEMEDATIAQRNAIATQTQRMEQELKRLENQRDLQVITAKLKAYSVADSNEKCDGNSYVGEAAIPRRSEAAILRGSEAAIHIGSESAIARGSEAAIPRVSEAAIPRSSEALVVQALHDTMVLTRLPAPEPTIFLGDPLNFIEWSTSFKTLIERRCTNPADRLFYLQKYTGGKARSVLEGSFFRKDAEAYDQAWATLNTRYGHPFVIQSAFRDKLNNWPKIERREADKLRQFSDFLTACSNAMEHVKGLQVLNDCEENKKLVKKLPEHVSERWNRIVTKKLKKMEDYPDFKEFALFLAEEAEVACNPVTSFHALKSTEERPSRDPKRAKASVFSTDVRAPEKKEAAVKTNNAAHVNLLETRE